MKKDINIGKGVTLNIEDCHTVSREYSSVILSEESLDAIQKSNEFLLKSAYERMPIYGLNTQFGNQVGLYDVNIDGELEKYKESINQRQFNLIMSHNCGLGDALSKEDTRAAMLLRAHCLGQGYSGIREKVVESLIGFLNNDICPIVYKYGSIGASGDLIPLSGIAAALCGQDVDVIYDNKVIKAKEAIKLAGLEELKLEVREGLSLINGTSFFTGIAALSIYDLKRVFNQMLSAIAMSLESLCVIESAYDPLVHKLKGNKGEVEVNNFILKFWQGSKMLRNLDSIREESIKDIDNVNPSLKHLQDYYSLRSVPQGFGVFFENLNRVEEWVKNEMNSVNDNPIINSETNSIFQAANFMGYHVTESCDILKIDISQASTWIHSILANMVHPRKSFGLPANLINNPQIYNGFRPLQILSAAIAVQNKKLVQSQQVFMIPTEGDNQDVNSLAMHAALDLKEATLNIERLVAILYLAASQAIELRGKEKSGVKAQQILETVRTAVPFIHEDRSFRNDIESVIKLMRENKI